MASGVDGPEDEENNPLVFLDTLGELADPDESPFLEKRPTCSQCRRPIRVCWCPYLPHSPIPVDTTVYLLQHPYEESRRLKTAPMLYHSLPPGKCHIFRGKRFSEHRNPEVAEILRASNTILLYPGPGAVDITELPPNVDGKNYNLVLLDGTWDQARSLYCGNSIMTWPKKVQINHNHKSKYVIRTQPNDNALSTLETAAVAISILENKPEIVELLTKPLEAMCKFQMQHGAVQHDSKVFKIENGLWLKKLPKKVLMKMEKEKNAKSHTEDSNS